MRAALRRCLVLGLTTLAPASAWAQAAPDFTLPALDIPASVQGTESERALKRREWARAEDLLAAEIARAPRSPDLLILIGRVFLIEQKPLNTAIAIKKAEALGPIDHGARFTLVLAYLALKRSDWARPELERLAAEDRSSPLYEYWLGRLDYEAAQYASAVRRFEEVIARDPTFVRAHDNLGLALEALNEPERALTLYRRAVALNREAPSKSPWPPLNLGILLRQRGEFAEAERLFREALETDDTFARARYQLGAVLEQQGRVEEAISELVSAAGGDASYAEPHYALARIYRRQGRAAEAAQALATFKTLHDAQRQAR